MREQATFFLSGYRGNARNAMYPHRFLVASTEDMRRVAAFDHVCAEYRNNHRSKDDFIQSDMSMFDLDNTHSDNPADWKTLDDVRAAFPGVPFYAVESRNHMKVKDGKSARPKYHIYSPHHMITSMVEYARLKNWVVAAFPYFDLNAKDAARFFYGVDDPKVYYYDGKILIDEYLPWSKTPPPEAGSGTGQLHEADSAEEKTSFSLPDVIPYGARNDTLHKYAFRLYMMGLNPDEVLTLTDRANDRCVEPLEREEIIALVNSACKQEHNRRAYIDRIDAIMTFSEASKEQAKTLDQTDVVCLEDMAEKAPEWLVPGYIPKGEITVMAGDGGTGKTFCWCSIAAAISGGNKCFLLNDTFPDYVDREPQKVMYFSSEDSNEAILRRRLRENGATLKNIVTIDSSDERFSSVTLNSAYFEKLLGAHRPALCIFDPLQSFLPRGVSMIARNEMRGAMAKLHVYGEKYGTTFLIIMHTNKKSDVWGRNRLADSADIWDISRSVLVVGKADSERTTTRYLSQEKSSYGRESQTVLFRINGNVVDFASYTDKRDRDFVLAAARSGKEAPAREAAERFILEDGERNVLQTAANIADAVTKEMTPDSPEVDVTADSVIGGMQAVINGLGGVADTFKVILDTIRSMGGLLTPQIAAGTVVPYKTKIDTTGSDNDDIIATLETLNGDLESVIIQAVNNAVIALVEAIQNNGGGNRTMDVKTLTSQVIDEINRRTRAQGTSPIIV